MKNWIKPEVEQRLRTLLHNKIFGGALLLGYFVTGILIALLVPSDFLSTNALARSFVGSMGEVIPAIEKVGNFSKLSEVAQFHMAVMWVLSPIIVSFITLGSWLQPRAKFEKILQEAKTHRFGAFMALVVPPFFMVGIYTLSLGDSPGIQLTAYLGSRSGLAIWTLVGPMGVFVFFSLWLGMLKVIKPLLMTIFLWS
jgi:hypothetical protein